MNVVEKKKTFHYYSTYTLCFLILSFFCFSWYIFSGRSLIWQTDGWEQHFRALLYYSEYLRDIIGNLITEHRLVIPDWNFYISEGNGIISTLNYYVIGDPIALLSVFVPAQYMHYFYSFSCILRLYLAGIAFSVLAFGTGAKNQYGVLAGALSYSFCEWMFYNAARHPYFMNPMIYFPLLLLGIEKIIKKERPYLFIVMVAISAASNFYFFYMIVLLTVVYVVVRLGFHNRKDWGKSLLTIGKITLMAVLGLCIAGILFLPVLLTFFQDARLSAAQPFHLFYPLSYYSMLPSIAVSDASSYWLTMGYGAPIWISCFYLFLTKKKNAFFKVLFLIFAVIAIFPIAGRVLNGMSYITNRWVWALALLCSYILAQQWDALLSLEDKEWRKLFICCAVFYAACLMLDKSRESTGTLAAIPIFFITLMAMKEGLLFHKHVLRQAAVIVLIGISAINVSFWLNAPTAGDYAAESLENRSIQTMLEDNEALIIKQLAQGEEYPRYSGRSISDNVSLTNEVSSTQYYWSLSNPAMCQFRASMEMREDRTFLYQGYDDRTTLLALASVQYYSTKSGDSKGLPYGYEMLGTYNTQEATQKQALEDLKLELGTEELSSAQQAKIADSTTNEYTIYKNQYALPLGYCYDSFITKETWERLNPIQKQEVQLEAVYLNTPAAPLKEYSEEMSDYLIPYTVECASDEITMADNRLIATANKTKVVFNFTGAKNAETYLRIAGLDFERVPDLDLYSTDTEVDPLDLYNKTNWALLKHQDQLSIRTAKRYWNDISNISLKLSSSAKVSKSFIYRPADSSFSSGRQDFLINFGYTKKPVTSITVTLPYKGIYTFDALEVYSVPMKQFPEKIQALQANTLEDLELDTDTVRGTLTLDSPKFLCMAIPYSDGWKALIDGKEAEVLVANERYLGVVVPEGEHNIVFMYSTPGKRAGAIVSLIGITAFLALLAMTETSRTKKRLQQTEQ
ncbi:MAG: hypothetical protein E7320_03570 [Clostridiales bacterium]|nr:hypothetical protein [Clostridiales bacterium]